MPWRGWKDILFRVKDELARDSISVVAAGVAFFAMLAVFPALAALVSIFGLLVDPAELNRYFAQMTALLPREAAGILHAQLERIVTAETSKLGFAAVFGFLLTLWSASKGVKALFEALNIVYDERERRGFLELNLLALSFTLAGILLLVILLAAVAGIPVLIDLLGLGGLAAWLLSVGRWPLVAAIVMVAMAVLFRFGVSRTEARWQWISWGAAGGTLVWIAASMGFSWYVANFSSYNETYGSLGAVVALLIWFYLSAYIVLLAGEVNAELEHQTARDTTAGPARPMGERGAHVADTLGEAHND